MKLSHKGRSGTAPALVVVMAVLCVVPFLPVSSRVEFMCAIALTYAIAAVGLDLFSGYGGQLMLGSFAFLGVGAYTSAVLQATFGWPVWSSLPMAVAVPGLIAFVVGKAMTRLPDIGIAMGTFFFATVVIVLLNGRMLAPWTRGANGIPVTPASFFGVELNVGMPFYWLAYACLVAAAVVTYRYANSRAGRALRLAKRSSVVAMSMGVDPARHKLAAFTYCAMCAGLGGFVYAQGIGYLSPENFGAFESINVLTMAIVGGLGSIAGPIIGAVAVTSVGELSRSAEGAREIVFAIALLSCLIFFPGGIYGAVEKILPSLRGRWRAGRRTAVAHSLSSASSTDAHEDLPPQGLSIAGATVKFGGVRALDDVTFEVPAGKITAVIGPNGAGKTTLLNCISGVHHFDGNVAFGDARLAGMPSIGIRRLGIARTFQHPSLVSDLSALENVELGAYGDAPAHPYLDVIGLGAGARDGRARAAALRALNMVGFPASRWDVPAADLTLAEQKIVDIARAAAGGRRLLLLDEPTAGLEEEEIDAVARLLASLNASGRLTIIVIAHHIGFVRKVAHHTVVLNFGRVLATGEPDVVTRRSDVTEVFLGTANA